MNMKNIIEIQNLRKSYGNNVAVNDLSFSVKEGEFFSFLGINGAGKSTTISILTGALNKNSGKVIIDGHDIDKELDEIHKEIGVVFQCSTLDSKLSVKDNLESRAALYGYSKKEIKERINELASLLDFKDLLKRKLMYLSGGQKRRIDVARGLLNHPKILILDEPTTGLDPMTRKILWSTINSLREKEKMTVFLTTHYMEEASESDYILIIDKGQKIAEGTPNELKNKYTGDFIYLYGVTLEQIKTLNLPFKQYNDYFKVEVKNTLEARDLIVQHPEIFKDFEITKGKMDDVFLSVTGKELKEENK